MAQKAMVNHLVYLLMWALFVMNIAQSHCAIPSNVSITYVESAVAEGAVCLDGSPPAYHFAKGFGDGVNNWMVFLYGGGWCTNETECLNWPGSSKGAKPLNLTGIFSQNKTVNPDLYNWNRVGLKYCDGSSFMGDVEAVDPDTKLHYRGARIFNVLIKELLSKGLAKAKNVLLAGNSAGGLATILRCDGFRALIPNASRVKCLADSGFFIRAKGLAGVEERENYYSRLVKFHNMTTHLPKSCTSKMDPGLCLFPENLVRHIQTPLFLLNSDFDAYQLRVKVKPHPADQATWENCTRNLKLCVPSQIQTMRDFRTAFLKTLDGVGKCKSRGMFITSCYIHDILYGDITISQNKSFKLGDKSIIQAIGDWYFDRSSFQKIDTKNDYPRNCSISINH